MERWQFHIRCFAYRLPLYILAALPSYVLSALLHMKAIFALCALCAAAKGQLISE